LAVAIGRYVVYVVEMSRYRYRIITLFVHLSRESGWVLKPLSAALLL
jgi:hypothetical protein